MKDLLALYPFWLLLRWAIWPTGLLFGLRIIHYYVYGFFLCICIFFKKILQLKGSNGDIVQADHLISTVLSKSE